MTGFYLKLLAMITMFVDHIGTIFFPQYIGFRILGRISFPIYCFLLVEGYKHTHNLKKYMLRLGIFAFISEIPFDLAFNGQIFFVGSQNIFFTLFIGVLALYCIDYFKDNKLIGFVFVVLLCILADILKCDYGYMGVLSILGFYLFKNQSLNLVLWQTILSFPLFSIGVFRIFALIPIFFYNGKKGYNIKYLFYIFYPLHLLIFYIISILIR